MPCLYPGGKNCPRSRAGRRIPPAPIQEDPMNPVTMHTILPGTFGQFEQYRLELQVTAGNGKLSISGPESTQKPKKLLKLPMPISKPTYPGLTPC